MARLKDCIFIRKLVNDKATEFTLDLSDVKDDDSLLDSCELDEDFDDSRDHDSNFELIKFPFDTISKKMFNITDDGKIKKMIVTKGYGGAIPPESTILFHYCCYLEKQDVPFDSSYSRQKPFCVKIGDGALYSGFDISLSSMKLKESSKFLVGPKYAFGSMGCPPRIPPNATLLLEIELLKLIDSSEIDKTDVSLEEKESYVGSFSKAKQYYLLGNHLFEKDDIFGAIDKYRRAENILHSCKMISDEEEENCRKILLKVYTNMCVCYNHHKINSPERTCIMFREAMYINPQKAESSAKLLFHFGKAQLMLQDFNKSRDYLNKALFLEPNNRDIKDTLSQLETKKKKYYSHEKLTYQKMFKRNQNSIIKNVEPKLEFEATFRDQLAELINGNQMKLELPQGLTNGEKKICREISEEYGLTYEEVMICGKWFFSVSK